VAEHVSARFIARHRTGHYQRAILYGCGPEERSSSYIERGGTAPPTGRACEYCRFLHNDPDIA